MRIRGRSIDSGRGGVLARCIRLSYGQVRPLCQHGAVCPILPIIPRLRCCRESPGLGLNTVQGELFRFFMCIPSLGISRRVGGIDRADDKKLQPALHEGWSSSGSVESMRCLLSGDHFGRLIPGGQSSWVRGRAFLGGDTGYGRGAEVLVESRWCRLWEALSGDEASILKADSPAPHHI